MPAHAPTVPAAMAAFARRQPPLPLAVAFSGGADSTALLHACTRQWPGQVQAWHVHHGLQAAADGFERHCAAVCARLGVPLRLRRVHAQPQPGQSPEDAARRARYAAFDALARSAADEGLPPVQSLALAQHADDQAETLLLALSRGAGLPGLAAMPGHWRRGALHCWRPFLQVPGQALRDWLHAQGLADWVEDPSNQDGRYTRNRIRAQLLPALAAVFPQFHATFARSAAHAAQAQSLLTELAAQDLQSAGNPPQLAALRALSPARQANVLRHWLGLHGTAASAAQLAQLQAQLAACRTRGHRIHLKVGAGHVQRVGDVLQWQPAAGGGALHQI